MKNASLEERFLSTKGRINRKIFILYAVCFILFCLFFDNTNVFSDYQYDRWDSS